MKYEHANDVLPEALVREIQKYAAGKLLYIPSTSGKRAWGEASGLLEEWVQCYIQLTCQIDLAGEDLLREDSSLFGVVKFPLRLIQREDSLAPLVSCGHSEDGSEPLPLLVHYVDGKFFCRVQMELLASLKQRKINAYPSIIIMKEQNDYQRFMQFYGNVFIYIK